MNIIAALQLAGFPVPERCAHVMLDSETAPTRVTFSCFPASSQCTPDGKTIVTHKVVRLNAEQAQVIAGAVLARKVGYRLARQR